jgi:signal transduction histidine kinase/ActR/RegA family two-component response regulator
MLAWTRSIRGKVVLVVLATTFVALLVAALAMVHYETQNYRQAAVADLTTQADIMARANAPALAFDDPKAASENLAVMRARPSILSAALYKPSGALFASYRKPDLRDGAVPQRLEVEGVRIGGNEIEVFQPVIENQERLGSVYLRADYRLQERLVDYFAILLAVFLAAFAVAVLMSAVLQTAITKPILAVTDVARNVIDKRDFSQRVERTTGDEIGYLVDAFNAMIAEVGQRSEALEASNRSLESEMIERRGAEEALRAADRRKDEFLATLAHELRNPLAPLCNGLEILKLANRQPAIADKMREMMERQLRQMVRLVDDLLDVSRISTGKLLLRKAPVDLQTVVKDAVETASPFIHSRNHTLSVSLSPPSIVLDADATRLAQVFSNLLNNAAKYTDPGGQIALDVQRNNGIIVARVTDNGIGIDRQMLTTVFDLFAQADQSLERTQAGLGVGLTLAKRLTELHGGTLEAQSEGLGKGSEFIVRLPVESGFDAVGQLHSLATSAGLSSGHRVLVVDDNRDFAASLAVMLEELGNHVRVANDGAEGLEVAKEFLPNVAFLDIGMPKLNGYDLAARLRSISELEHLHLVAITGWGQEKDRQRAHVAGFDRHLVKPVESEQIVAILRALPAQSIDRPPPLSVA